MLPRHMLARVIRMALEEDIGAGDITTGAALTGAEKGIARATTISDLAVARAMPVSSPVSAAPVVMSPAPMSSSRAMRITLVSIYRDSMMFSLQDLAH
jgi:hypothetical protein